MDVSKINASKIAIYALSGLALISLFFCLVTLGYSSVERVSSQSLAQQLEEYEQKEKEAAEFEAYHKRWQNIAKEFEDYKNRFLMGMDELSGFRNELETILRKNSLNNLGIKYAYKEVFADVIRVSIKFTAQGSYQALKHFIRDIRVHKKLVVIRGMELGKSKRGPEISGEFSMEVYLVR